jgi:hypothetical protein
VYTHVLAPADVAAHFEAGSRRQPPDTDRPHRHDDVPIRMKESSPRRILGRGCG